MIRLRLASSLSSLISEIIAVGVVVLIQRALHATSRFHPDPGL